MLYSVWDYRRQVYDYFEAPGEVPAVGRFRAPVGDRTMPESLAVRVPAGARAAGSGERLRGVAATTDTQVGALQADGDQPSRFRWAILGAAAALYGPTVWRWVRRRFGGVR
jgi:hypothetical protein